MIDNATPEAPQRCVTCSLPLTTAEIECESLTMECFDCHASTEDASPGWCGRLDRHHEGHEPGYSECQYEGWGNEEA